MKKLVNVYLVVILLFVILIVYYAFFDNSHKAYKVIYCDSLNSQDVYNIYCLNDKNEIDVVSCALDGEDIYQNIFQIYNEYQNSLPVNYYSPLNGLVEVEEIEKQDKTLVIEIVTLPKKCDYYNFFECLKKTYSQFGIERIVLKSKNSEIVI